jgi:hypothetical protein
MLAIAFIKNCYLTYLDTLIYLPIGRSIHTQLCAVCVAACDRCADECARHEHEHYRLCADSCRQMSVAIAASILQPIAIATEGGIFCPP